MLRRAALYIVWIAVGMYRGMDCSGDERVVAEGHYRTLRGWGLISGLLATHLDLLGVRPERFWHEGVKKDFKLNHKKIQPVKNYEEPSNQSRA